jgi:hypothetical protein
VAWPAGALTEACGQAIGCPVRRSTGTATQAASANAQLAVSAISAAREIET